MTKEEKLAELRRQLEEAKQQKAKFGPTPRSKAGLVTMDELNSYVPGNQIADSSEDILKRAQLQEQLGEAQENTETNALSVIGDRFDSYYGEPARAVADVLNLDTPGDLGGFATLVGSGGYAALEAKKQLGFRAADQRLFNALNASGDGLNPEIEEAIEKSSKKGSGKKAKKNPNSNELKAKLENKELELEAKTKSFKASRFDQSPTGASELSKLQTEVESLRNQLSESSKAGNTRKATRLTKEIREIAQKHNIDLTDWDKMPGDTPSAKLQGQIHKQLGDRNYALGRTIRKPDDITEAEKNRPKNFPRTRSVLNVAKKATPGILGAAALVPVAKGMYDTGVNMYNYSENMEKLSEFDADLNKHNKSVIERKMRDVASYMSEKPEGSKDYMEAEAYLNQLQEELKEY